MRIDVLSRVRIAAAAVTVLMAVMLAGCGGGESSSSSGSSDSGDSGQAQAGGVLHTAQLAEPVTLDPSKVFDYSGINVSAQINEPLFKLDESGKVVPLLAASFKRSSDNLTWTFPLRKGVEFSNGQPLTAKDVVFSLGVTRKAPYWEGLLEEVKSVTALSPTSIQIKTKKPMPALVADLSSYGAGIIPDNYGGMSEKEFAQNPIGTGPFMLKKWAHGQAITLVKNPHYWQQGEPLANEVVFTTVEDDNSRLAQFRGGELDFIDSHLWSQLKSLEQTPGIEVHNYGQYRIDYLGLNMNEPLFANRHVREAINLAVDREGINSAALGGSGELATSYLPPTIPGFDKSLQVTEQNVDKAKQLLAEAVKEGVKPSFTLATYAGEAYAEAAAQIIQQNLDEVGFKVTLQPYDHAALYERYETGENAATLAEYYAAVSDPSELTAYYLGLVAKPLGADTAPLEKLAAEASTEIDSGKREALYAEIQQGVAEELQSVPLDYQPLIYLRQEDISGLEVNPIATIWLNKAGFGK